MREACLFALGIGLLALTGCAKPLRLEEPAGRVQVGFDGGADRLLVVRTPFEDGRTPPSCSASRMGSGDSLGDYAALHKQLGCSPLPPAWVARRLAKGLQAAEFTLVDPDSVMSLSPEARARLPQVRGRLDLLEVEAFSRMQSVITEADLQAEIFVSTRDGLSASRRFHVKSQRVGMTSGSERAQESLDELIDRAVREMTAGVVSLLNRYPEPSPGEPAP